MGTTDHGTTVLDDAISSSGQFRLIGRLGRRTPLHRPTAGATLPSPSNGQRAIRFQSLDPVDSHEAIPLRSCDAINSVDASTWVCENDTMHYTSIDMVHEHMVRRTNVPDAWSGGLPSTAFSDFLLQLPRPRD